MKEFEDLQKIKIQHGTPVRIDGKFVIRSIDQITEMTLEDIRELLHIAADTYIDNLLESTKGHITTHGLLIHPLIHIVHDDEALDNTDYQKFLKEEIRKERLNKLKKLQNEK